VREVHVSHGEEEGAHSCSQDEPTISNGPWASSDHLIHNSAVGNTHIYTFWHSNMDSKLSRGCN
jgi:hypothetical protein